MKQSIRIPSDDVQRARHGLNWTEDEHKKLLDLWDNTQLDLIEICERMQRPAAGIAAKLLIHNRIWGDPNRPGLFWHNPRKSIAPEFLIEEDTMNDDNKACVAAPNIEHKTFIAGVDAARLSDGQIFAKIAEIEGKIEKLKSIKAKSKKLAAAIAGLQNDVAMLVEYVDTREA